MKDIMLPVFLGALLLCASPFCYALAQSGPDREEGFQNGRPGAQGGAMGIRNFLLKREAGNGNRGGMGDRFGMRGKRDLAGLPEEEEIVATVNKYDPAFAASLAELKKIAPQKYKTILALAGKMLGMVRMENQEGLEKDAVRTVALEYETKELAIKYGKAAAAEKAGIKTDLKLKLSDLFDLRLKGQEIRIKRMEKDLAKLKSDLEARRAGKAKIVEERFGQMTGESPSW